MGSPRAAGRRASTSRSPRPGPARPPALGPRRCARHSGGRADLAIRFGDGRYPGLQADHLLDDAITVLGPAGMAPDTPWGDVRFIEDAGATAVEPWSHWAPWWRGAGLPEPPATHRLAVSDSGLALAACRSGLGLCLGRLSVAHDALRRGEVRALRPWRRTEFAYYLVSRPAVAATPRVTAFRAWLREALRPLAEEDVRLGTA